MKLISVTAFILSYLLIDGIANSHPMGGSLEEAIDQVDNDIFFETEDYRQQYGDGDDDGLTGGGADNMNGSQLLVGNEEDNITRNVSRMSSKSFKFGVFKSTKTYKSYKRIANSHPMGGSLEVAIDQVDNDIYFETEDYRQQYGDGDDDGLTGGGADVMNGSQRLVANEEDNITCNIRRMSSKSFKLHCTG